MNPSGPKYLHRQCRPSALEFSASSQWLSEKRVRIFISRWAAQGYGLAHFMKKELRSRVPVGTRRRLQMWRRGFSGEAYVLYGLERDDWHDYLPDIRKAMNGSLVNGPIGPVLRSKPLFPLIVAPLPELGIPILATIKRGAILCRHGQVMSFESFMDLLFAESALVVRLAFAASGRGMCVIRADQTAVTINDRPVDAVGIRKWLHQRPYSVVTAFLRQHPALAELYGRTTNTLRLLTMRDGETGEPFVAGSVLRIGTSRSFPVDNWAAGGLSAEIDIDSGRVGRAVGLSADSGSLTWHETHPETGSPIVGIIIPYWENIIHGILELCRRHPPLRCVGWDVIVTMDGYRLIEGNDTSSIVIHQVHSPLLRSERVRRFCQEVGFIR